MQTRSEGNPKVYFAGSIRGGRDDAAWYAELIAYISQFATVLTEHIGLIALGTDGDVGLSVAEIYERDIAWIEEADAVVAEVSTPSLGVGYELRIAEQRGIPVLCLFRADTGRKLSAMIAGAPYYTGKIMEYSLAETEKVHRAVEQFIQGL